MHVRFSLKVRYTKYFEYSFSTSSYFTSICRGKNVSRYESDSEPNYARLAKFKKISNDIILRKMNETEREYDDRSVFWKMGELNG